MRGLLAEDAPAPAFEGLDQDGVPIRLADFRGRWLVLYFYPKDDTPGCDVEACSFRDHFADLRRVGAEVVGVSSDSVASHRDFAAKRRLPFRLVADPEKRILDAYNARSIFGVTYLIDPSGRIRKTYPFIHPKRHAATILEDLRKIARNDGVSAPGRMSTNAEL
jgi:thioredoxin-dependent peroxiredoxin